MRQELCAIGEVAAALKLECYIKDVDKELTHAEKKLIKLKALDYEVSTLLKWSKEFKTKYGW